MAQEITEVESEKVKNFIQEPSDTVFLTFSKAELKQLVVFWGGTPTSTQKKEEFRNRLR